MNVVIVGHVDHGKSTLIGRLLADTNTLPEGKLEAVKENCRRNAKPFEYAFLLDALKDEQSQGITIDTARCFFKSTSRDYIIIDAPGHIEFLKNMVTGAARAEAAVLVIDAKEGIRENSKRHGYIMSFLGIKNVAIAVNKMDLVGYDEKIFNEIKKTFLEFLREINLKPMNVIPVAAREGDNIVLKSTNMSWYQGPTIVEALDGFRKLPPTDELEFRFPVQDVYKFTEGGDDRRIFAGRVESGTVHVGDEVIFLPSNKRTTVTSIEAFNSKPLSEAFAGQSAGFCVDTQLYVKPGQIMCRANETLPHVTTKFKVNIFWMGKQPFIQGKTYKLKIVSQHVPVVLSKIIGVLDASELSSISNKQQVDRHDVAECVLETLKPIAFDEVAKFPVTGRFVIVDNYEIVGGGIVLSPVYEEDSALKQYIRSREFQWERGGVTPFHRAMKYQHKSALVVITGDSSQKQTQVAKSLEEKLFQMGNFTYFLGIPSDSIVAAVKSTDRTLGKIEQVKNLGEIAHTLTDAGLILITSVHDLDDVDLETLKALNHPNKTLSVRICDNPDPSQNVDLELTPGENIQDDVKKIVDLLIRSVVLDPEYSI